MPLVNFEPFTPSSDHETDDLIITEPKNVLTDLNLVNEVVLHKTIVDAPDLVAMKRQRMYREMREQLLGELSLNISIIEVHKLICLILVLFKRNITFC